MSIERRARRDGSVGYQVRVSVGGKRLPAETFDTRRAARRREAELVAKRRRATTDETCGSFARRWPDDFAVSKAGPTPGRRKSQRTIDSYRERLKPFIAELGSVKLADVDRPRAVVFAQRHPRSAATARGLFADALDAGLVDTNPFARLNLEEKRGRRDYAPLTVKELHRLADLAVEVHGPDYGPKLRAMILFTAYVGPRLEEACALEWPWIDFAASDVAFKVAKFDKPRTVVLLREAADALRAMPRPVDGDPHVFRGKRASQSASAQATTGPGTRSDRPSGRACQSSAAARSSTWTGTRSATSRATTSTSRSASLTS